MVPGSGLPGGGGGGLRPGERNLGLPERQGVGGENSHRDDLQTASPLAGGNPSGPRGRSPGAATTAASCKGSFSRLFLTSLRGELYAKFSRKRPQGAAGRIFLKGDNLSWRLTKRPAPGTSSGNRIASCRRKITVPAWNC